MAISLDEFRLGMRRLAASVCVITTENDEGARAGLTATAVCSVSAEPPTLLCCVNRGNASHAAILNAGRFAVNVLSVSDEAVANKFASRASAEERFAAGLWVKGEAGAPMLETALVSFDCRITQSVNVGTHGIFFGEIASMRARAGDTSPLLYGQGAYGGFSSVDATKEKELLWLVNWYNED